MQVIRVLCSESHQAEIKMSTAAVISSEVRVLIQTHSGYWKNLFSCSSRTVLRAIFLLVLLGVTLRS